MGFIPVNTCSSNIVIMISNKQMRVVWFDAGTLIYITVVLAVLESGTVFLFYTTAWLQHQYIAQY